MTFFVDRSLGSRQVPEALRSAGHEVVAHDELFAPDTDDEVWLRRAGEEGWIVLMKDDRIRYRRREREALRAAGVQAFVLTNANLKGHDQAALFVAHAAQITTWVRSNSGPAIVGVYRRPPHLRVLGRAPE